jgi:hypothetical protein
VTVSEPAGLYLESVTGSILEPRVLDVDGQEYAPRKGASVVFNVTYTNLTRENEYSFEVPEATVAPVVAKCVVSNKLWSVRDTALLFPHRLIYPVTPVIQRGASIAFVCHSSKPKWYSMNERVASVSTGGIVKALKSGRSVIRCTDEIETQVQVVEFEDVSLKQTDEFTYLIQPKFSVNDIDRNKLHYVEDLTYKCSWDARLCGNVTHEEINGSHFCILRTYESRLCDERSLLDVTVDSANAGLHLIGSTEVIYRKMPFGIPSNFSLSVSKVRPSVHFVVDVASDSIFHQAPAGLEVRIEDGRDDKTVVTLTAATTFEKGDVILEDKASGEKVKIRVGRDRWSWSSVYLSRHLRKYDQQLFYISVFFTLVLGGYIAYRMGAGALLPPLSPYAMH